MKWINKYLINIYHCDLSNNPSIKLYIPDSFHGFKKLNLRMRPCPFSLRLLHGLNSNEVVSAVTHELVRNHQTISLFSKV